MTQEKLRKVVTAVTVAATALLVFLLAVIVYQVVTMCVLTNREKELEEENKKLQQQIDENTLDAEYYESVIGKEWLAFQNGFIRNPEGDK